MEKRPHASGLFHCDFAGRIGFPPDHETVKAELTERSTVAILVNVFAVDDALTDSDAVLCA